MKLKIDVTTLNIEQARALVVHLDSHLEAALTCNANFVTTLGELKFEFEVANKLVTQLNTWSAVNNRLTLASAAEVQRILQTDQTVTSTLQ